MSFQNFQTFIKYRKQSSRCIPMNRCPENIQQIYRRTPMLYCDFTKVLNQLCWNHTPVSLLHFLGHPFIGTPLEVASEISIVLRYTEKDYLFYSMERSETTIISNTEINLTFYVLIFRFFYCTAHIYTSENLGYR